MYSQTQNSAALANNPEQPALVSLISPEVLRRAGIISAALGSVLTLANQSDALFGTANIQYFPLVLVFLTPFVVVTLSQVLGIRQAMNDASVHDAPDDRSENIFSTATSHGIPLRAALVGLIVGGVNVIIVLSEALVGQGQIANVAVAPIVQAFLLPVLFGMVSQAIGYRRAATAVNKGHVATVQAAAF